jgi:hypothetical protein
MSKFLQVVEPHYPPAGFSAGEPDADRRIREAATAYKYRLWKGKVASNSIGKVILIAATERRVEALLDVLRYDHPLGTHPQVNALPTPHARFVGEVHFALRELGSTRGWDLDALDKAYRQVFADDYRFHVIQIKPKANPGRTCAVAVEWRTGDALEIGFTITPKRGETRWLPFLASPIGLGKIDVAAGKLAWQDDRIALLDHRNKRDRWRLDVETLEVDFLYAPAEQGNPHGQYALGKMYLDGNLWVNANRDKARYWLQRSADQGFARAKTLLEKAFEEPGR